MKKNKSRPDHYEAIKRGMAILGMMGRTAITIKQIHQKLLDHGFDVSLRTVERDMKALPEVFPQHVYVIVSKPNGYKLPQGSQKLSGMTPEEAVTLQLANDYLKPLLPQGSLDPIAPYLKEAEIILGQKKTSTSMKNWKNKVLPLNEGFNLQPAIIKDGLLKVIKNALWTGKMLKVEYTSKHKTEPSEYLLHPCGLVYRGRISYLVCSFDGDTDKFIYLPLHRFQSVEITKGYSAHRDKNIKKVAKDLVGFKVNPDKIKVLLKFSRFAGGHLYETPISKKQKITKTRDGYLLVEDLVNDDMELRFWIRAFGGEVEVIKPKSLRDEFTQMSRRIGRKYAKS